MAEVSRTARVIQNAKVALFFYCINLILQFFSRKIFLDYLGAELLGLNTTAQNLLQFLNIAESGIGAAIAFALYNPLSKGNKQEINDIVSLQGWLYRWVGLFVITGALILMALFPWFFAKAEVPLLYVYLAFIAFLISSLLGYFVNYKTVVLSADQKEYKIILDSQGFNSVKIIIQMFLVCTLSQGYLWWLLLEVVTSAFISIRLTYRVRSEYSWLKTDFININGLKKQYSSILIKTKQLFFHKIASFVLSQTTPLIIYFFSSLSLVGIYGNYLVIMNGCLYLMDALTRGLSASVGNLVAESSNEHIKKAFLELVSLKIFFSGWILFCLLLLSESFMEIWVGKEYLLPKEPLVIMSTMYFIQMSRVSDMFLAAYGLFKDIWAPIVEACLSLFLSVFLGYFFGLSGILFGTLVSQIIIVNSWKPFFLYRDGFKTSVLGYVFFYTKNIAILILVFCVVKNIIDYIELINGSGYLAWLLTAAVVSIIYFVVSTICFYCFNPSFRAFIFKLSKGIQGHQH